MFEHLTIWHGWSGIRHIKVLFCSNGLAIWHGLSDIRHIKVNYGRQSALLILIKLKFLRTYPYLKLHILFYSNGLAIWSDFPDITLIKKIMADNRPFWPP